MQEITENKFHEFTNYNLLQKQGPMLFWPFQIFSNFFKVKKIFVNFFFWNGGTSWMCLVISKCVPKSNGFVFTLFCISNSFIVKLYCLSFSLSSCSNVSFWIRSSISNLSLWICLSFSFSLSSFSYFLLDSFFPFQLLYSNSFFPFQLSFFPLQLIDSNSFFLLTIPAESAAGYQVLITASQFELWE